MKFETQLIHAGNTTDKETGAVSTPIYQTSTFKQTTFGEHTGYEYARTGNPTRAALERLIQELEGGTQGFAFASGLAAITTVFSLFKSGDHFVISDNIYGGTFRLLEHVFKHFGISYTSVDTGNHEYVEAAIQTNTVALFIESPTNPLLSITSIREISSIGHNHNLLTIVDNTFMSPYLQQPLSLGADIVVHSATKYLGGHSDLVAGLVVVNSESLGERIAFLQNAMGAILGPQDAFLLIRGIKTLSIRLDRHILNTQEILEVLRDSQYVKRIYHPSLKSHPRSNIFATETRGSVPIISFEVADGVDIKEMGRKLNVITVGESLGGVESLISHPASMTHASYPKEIRDEIGITDSLLRISVGIEHHDDLIEDLLNALEAAYHGSI